LRRSFEFENQDGSEVTTVPETHTWYPKPDYGIAISFDNFATYKYDYGEFTEGDVPVDLGDALVKTMYRWDTAGAAAQSKAACGNYGNISMQEKHKPRSCTNG
jgi:hypothetical protein